MVEHLVSRMDRYGWSDMNLDMEVEDDGGNGVSEQKHGAIFSFLLDYKLYKYTVHMVLKI